jgi:carboxypeptidase family protein
MQTNRRYFAGFAVFVMAATLVLLSPTLNAQQTTATLTGTVYDASGAVVPGATVTLENMSSGDTRRTESNGDGYFTFGAVPPGNYSVTVQMKGFGTWEAKNIALSSGDKRTVSGVKLTPGGAVETVEVSGVADQVTPIDSGEKSVTIDEHILSNVAIVGQNAAEFVKIMPGMAFTGGAINQSSYAAQDERTGQGPVGSFSANGQRTGALDITSDGAHIIDPGCNCGQAMNTNADMTQELKVMTSNFGADEAKGPVVISSIGKSGGNQYHGELYTYNRYYALNANDWLYNAKGSYPNGQQVLPRPKTKYFFPGGNIGGPVLIPGTNFNRNRDKMFFFYGMEYYKQDVDNGVYESVVPTLQMRQGNFTEQLNGKNYISFLNGYAVTGLPNGGGPSGNAYSSGVINPSGSGIDPNGLVLMNTYPLPNLDPSLSASQGFNYVNGQTRFSNMLQERARVDYNFNDSTKLYVTYNHQHDNAINSLDVLWGGNAQGWMAPTTPYPTPLIESSTSHVITANLTKVFSPTLTNELIFSYTYLNLPNGFQDYNKITRGTLGLNYQMLFNHGDNTKLIFPQMTGWGDGISNQLNTGFELNNNVYAKKTLPSVADNVFKVWGTHTSKFGFYWERTWNSQPGNADVNGGLVFSNWGSNTSGNAYADMLIGQTTTYDETNYDVVPAFRFISAEFYGTDSWKVSRRLTLDYGLRVSHLGPWSDVTGYGFAAWYPSLFTGNTGASAQGVTFPGIEWNKSQSSTPLSGAASRAFFYEPRAGFAWDLFGTGKTVLRGGYGMYRYHDEQNVQNGAYGIVRGSFAINQWSPALSQITPLGSGASFGVPSNVTALDPKDSEAPRTQTYSFTVAQRAPWKSVLEVAYVGSTSDYLSNYNNNFDKINDLPVGALFNAYGWMANYSSGQQDSIRPYFKTPGGLKGYGAGLKIIDHKMYSNYNSLQASWNKQAGHFTFLANYTFSKALGIRGESGSGTGDPTNLRHNYGTLPNNRANIFNLAYVYELPTLATGNSFVKGAVNGWQVSGIVQYQTGADLQAAITNNYNFNYSAVIDPNQTSYNGTPIPAGTQASSVNVLGTNEITLMPQLTCNPRSGLTAHQYLNPNCFSPFAHVGQQGTYIIPTGAGPGFFNTDLSVFKNFTFGASESRKLQFRFSGYNFLNHPVRTFIAHDPALNLSFDKTGALTEPNGVEFGRADNKVGHRIMQGAVKFIW